MTGIAKFLTERAIRGPDYTALRFTTGLLLNSLSYYDLETPEKYIYYDHINFQIRNLLKAQEISGVPASG